MSAGSERASAALSALDTSAKDFIAKRSATVAAAQNVKDADGATSVSNLMAAQITAAKAFGDAQDEVKASLMAINAEATAISETTVIANTISQ
jgi:D-Tyr-tRNAtyr deacylase